MRNINVSNKKIHMFEKSNAPFLQVSEQCSVNLTRLTKQVCNYNDDNDYDLSGLLYQTIQYMVKPLNKEVQNLCHKDILKIRLIQNLLTGSMTRSCLKVKPNR